MKKRIITTAAIAMLAASSFTAPAQAAAFEKHIGAFHSPFEWKLRCDKWWKPWKGAKICRAHTYQMLRHDFVLRATGPEIDEAARKVLLEALSAALAAAAGTGLLTPSPEPAARITVAIAAAKAAFLSHVMAHGLKGLASEYTVVVDHKTSW